jgi:hypothetical protein
MRGRLFTVLSALSTVGLVASLALWCVTRQDLYLAQHRSTSGFQIVSVRPLGIYVVVGRYLERPPVTGWEFERRLVEPEILGNGRFGFALGTGQGADPIRSGQTVRPTTCTFTLVLIPFWAAIGSTAVLPTVWLWRFRRRKPQGLCQSCGYDLRASTGRCPECGRSFEAAETSAP